MFAIAAVNAVLIDVQLCLPQNLFTSSLVELKNWYVREFDDYLGEEKPHFFVGLVWVELILQWPLLIANLYGILAAKPWYRTTCLLYGASFFTTMGAILPELLWSGKATNTLYNVDVVLPCCGLCHPGHTARVAPSVYRQYFNQWQKNNKKH